MFIDNFRIEVSDTKYDEKKEKQSKELEVVAWLNDYTGIGAKNFGKFLDDLAENNSTFCGDVEVIVKITKRQY
tara:strand:+ start:401 stop:619 length:219 start_codon:yes stop_codon:yes gene_type:complete